MPAMRANAELEYRMVPSLDSESAPSLMLSISTRYGCSAPSRVKTFSPDGPDTTSASTSPLRIASRVSSASCRRWRNSSSSRRTELLTWSFISSHLRLQGLRAPWDGQRDLQPCAAMEVVRPLLALEPRLCRIRLRGPAP